MASPATTMASSSSASEGKTVPQPVLVGDPGSTGSRELSGKDLRVAIVATRWYSEEIVGPLVDACAKELQDKGVECENIIRVLVSGAFELPFATMRLIQIEDDKLDAVICIGCMIKDRTMAYEFVSEAVTMGIMKLNVKTDTPVVFGVLTAEREVEAKACAATRGSSGSSSRTSSHGVEWAQSALEMARLKHCTASKIADKCKCRCHCHCSKCHCGVCTCSDCKCASCKHGGKPPGNTKTAETCVQCGDELAKCRCTDCKCASCCSEMAKGAGKTGEKTCSVCCSK